MNNCKFKPTRLAPVITALSALALPAQEIIKVNHDDFPAAGTYSYAYAGYGEIGGGNVAVDGSAFTQFSEVIFGPGTDNTAALRFTADTTAVEAAIVTPNNYSYMGFGIGTSANILAQLSSPDLANYTLDLSLSADGLTDGTDTATGVVDVRFFAPDGTLLPDDDDFDGDLILAARYASAVEAEDAIKEYSFRLDRPYEVRDGSLENFQNHFASIDFIQVVVEMNNAINTFGYDSGNIVVVDSILLTDSPPPPPPAENPVITLDFDTTPRTFGGSYSAFAGNPGAGDFPRTAEVIEDSEAGPSLVQRACLDTTTPAGEEPFEDGGYLGFSSTAAIAITSPVLPSSNIADYKVSFDSKASGFLADVGGKLLLNFSVPEGTLGVDDGDPNRDPILQLRFSNDGGFGNGFTIPEVYGTTSFNLSVARIDGGSLELFTQYYDQISNVSFVLEGNTRSQNTGFDDDNCIYMDNLQVLHLTPPAPEISAPQTVTVNAVAPNDFSLTFDSIPGHSYAILGATDLAAEFTEIDVITASTALTTFSSSQPIINREFFRVEDLGVLGE